MGCVTPVGEQGSDITKMIVQNADWDESVPGVQLDRFCASGLEAVNTAAQKVASGWEDLVVAGGIECMSRVPMGSNGGAMASDPAFALKTGFVPQGIGADMIATIDGYSREDVDGYAVESQRRAAQARDNGWFDRSVVPVKDAAGITILERDDFIKPGTTLEGLSRLKPSFEVPGPVSIIMGSVDNTVVATTRPRGVSAKSLPAFSLPISTALEPSTMPDEFPGV